MLKIYKKQLKREENVKENLDKMRGSSKKPRKETKN